MDEIAGSSNGGIGRRSGGYFDVGGEPGEGARNSVGCSSPDPVFIALVVVYGRVNKPPVNDMW